MQEEVTERTVALSVRAAKMTGRLLQSVLRKVLAEIRKKRDNPKIHRGRQSVKKLVRQGAGGAAEPESGGQSIVDSKGTD